MPIGTFQITSRGMSHCRIWRLLHWYLLKQTQWGLNKMAAIFQTTFSNEFSWMEITMPCLKFHLIHWGRAKWLPFTRRHFQMHFLEWKWKNFDRYFTVKFVPEGSLKNIPALVQIMAWRRPGDKPLSELMMIILLTHIYVTRPQWVKFVCNKKINQHLFR